jgi:hypothetical protein
MIQRKLSTLAAIGLAAILPALTAHADSGVYLGGGLTSTKIEDSAGNPGGMPFNDTATGGKLFAGYHVDAIPLFKFAVEAGYREAGQATESQAVGDVKYRIHGFDYAVLAGIGLGPVDLMGRVGGMNYKLEKNIGGVKNKYDGTAPVYGIGLWFTLVGVGIRAEYEKIDIDELDKSDMISVSAFYQF